MFTMLLEGGKTYTFDNTSCSYFIKNDVGSSGNINIKGIGKGVVSVDGADAEVIASEYAPLSAGQSINPSANTVFSIIISVDAGTTGIIYTIS